MADVGMEVKTWYWMPSLYFSGSPNKQENAAGAEYRSPPAQRSGSTRETSVLIMGTDCQLLI